ncbi:hypothetical protein LIER_39733 [Lithospermum erythrorhizon]|uniref:Uncharacterized protein n=1 Tax=Lithospermum erythrorhizon TaxID=34254 RepID=A0AAV3QPX8_LITER
MDNTVCFVFSLPHFSVRVMFLITSFIVIQNTQLCCLAFKTKHFNLSTAAPHWATAGATWYGAPDGFGSDGGSCGYGTSVSQAPFTSLVFGASPSLYKSGTECGACYLIKCTKKMHPACSGKPVRVVITDFCPGCTSGSAHFDLSGTAFGGMAIPGHDGKLRDAGVLNIRYARVACDYSGKNIVFHVDQGSNPSYFAAVIQYEEGDGDLAGVDLMQSSSSSSSSAADGWMKMQQSWGAVWMLNPGFELQPPFSIRLTSKLSGQTLVAKDVIPTGWQPGATYRSLVNFL